MSKTQLLSLSLIMPSQAQKHVTHNEALIKLDHLIHLSCISVRTNMPPSSPVAGQRLIIGENPVQAWQDYAQHIEVFEDQIWAFLKPQNGWQCWDQESQALYIFDQNIWMPYSVDSSSSLTNITTLGINATAD